MGTTDPDTGKPPPATDSSGGASSTGETDYGPFPGLDDDGGCTCVAARERRGGAAGAWLGLVALVLHLRRARRRSRL